VPSSVYIHLPFCKTKCPYCDFASFTDSSVREAYINALCNEINYRCQNLDSKIALKTIFFGGGTPSIHDAFEFERIFQALVKYFDFDEKTEITIEANPGTVDRDKLVSFKAVGINRLSLGVQTFSEKLIKYLARGHTVSEAKQIIELVSDIGFNSWSIDLIYGLPHQSMQDWQDTIATALSFKPAHVSSYALSIEENTPFGELYKNSLHEDLPQEQSVIDMYNHLNEALEENNIFRYEISNWARAGHEAKHNLCYWYADEYFAFGLSAHGYIDKKRYSNTRELKKYIDNFSNFEKKNFTGFIIDDFEIQEIINAEQALEEKIFLNLRLKSGLELGSKIEEKLNKTKLEEFIEAGFVEIENKRLMLTNKALMISNKIIFELIK
jgi:oxygen-independent coproporphyrinogen-3 oxidase